MAAKRTIEQDPEYEAIPAEIQEKRIKLIEDNVRNQTKKKIETIIKSNFEEEITKKHEEIESIDDLLHEGRCMLDRLRACIITKYYATLDQKPSEYTISPIHPCVKKYLGKSPRDINYSSTDISNQSSSSQLTEAEFSNQKSCNTNPLNQVSEKVWEVKPSTSQIDEISTRAPRFKKKCKIVVGNISKFIPVWQRDASDQSTHKWMVYVRGDKHNPSIESFVKKVRFLLHPSYRPSDIVDISSPPFHLIKRGWGEFPVRVQLHFHDVRNKPVDIIHNLKLDKTFTGLQTLGAETVVELQLFKPETSVSSCNGPYSSQTASTASKRTENNYTVSYNGPVSSVSNSIDKTSNTNVHTIVKKGPNSLVVNIKLPKNVSNSDSTSNIVNTHTSVPIKEESNPQRKLVPKLVISNNRVMTKPIVTNGINTTFVKCKDKEGRVLLVPQSSVTFKDPPNSIKQNNINTVANNSTAKTNKTVPSYVLKVVPNKDTGQNQVLLIPLMDKKTTEGKTPPITIKKEPVDPEKQQRLYQADIDSVIKKEPEFEETVITTPNYEQELENIKMEYCKTFEEILKKVSKIFPLFKKGVDRKIFTFCANSLEEFHSWNIGKQRAAEWRRASIVRKSIIDLLSRKKNPNLIAESVWSQSAIMSWLRKNGFVPMATGKVTLLPEPKWSGIELCSLTNADDLVSSLKEESTNLVNNSDEEEIEIINICDDKVKQQKTPNQISKEACFLPHFSDEALFVKQTASQIGVDIKPTEVEPNLHVPVIEEMILSACRQFASDLIGSSLDEGFNRLGGKICPEEVTVSDVYSAIKNTPQFDFLSNSFLGVPKEPTGTT